MVIDSAGRVSSSSADSVPSFTPSSSSSSLDVSTDQPPDITERKTPNTTRSTHHLDNASTLTDIVTQSTASSSLSEVVVTQSTASSSLSEVVTSSTVPSSVAPVTTTHNAVAKSACSVGSLWTGDRDDPNAEEAEDERWELHVVGLFAIDGPYPVGQAFQYAAELAEDDINSRPDVLPGYKIVLESVNTGCDIATGMDVLYQKLYNSSSTKVMVLGGTCSDTTEQTAHASRKHNMLQISYSVLSPRLSDREEFPWFFRVMAPETELSKARVALLQEFNWTTITFVQAAAHIFSATGEVMRKLLQENNMTVNGTFPFDSDLQRAIENLQRNKARILVFNSYEDQARNACCVAYKKGFYGGNIVWIFPGFYDLKWYDHDDFNCTAKDKLRVIDGYFTVSNVNMAPDEGDTIGATQEEFRQRFKCKALRSFWKARVKKSYRKKNQHFQGYLDRQLAGKSQQEIQSFSQEVTVPGESRAPLGYDAMWTIALTLNNTLTELLEQGRPPDALKDFSYFNKEMGEMMLKHMKNTSFRGLSGKVNFTPSGDRIPQIHIKQFQVIDFDAEDPPVELKVIGLYSTPTNITFNHTRIKWADGKPPFSSRCTERVLKPLSWELYLTMVLLACSGIIVSVLFLVFNIRNRHVRLIKMSSPKINNLILVGCMLGYTTVTVDDVYSQRLDALCHVRLYLLVMGFSLGFGALFAKTWRVYEIMTAAAGSRRLNTTALRDSRLYLIIFGLVAINLVVVVVWTAVDAMHMVRVDIKNAGVHRGDDVFEIPQSLVCHSRYKVHFTVGLMVLEALLILFGAFLAVQTRKVTIPELNDSRWVGLCIYNVVVLGSLGAILILGTRQSPDVTYLLESLIVLVGTTLTQCLIFMPKLLAFRRLKRGRQGSQQHMVTVKTLCLPATTSSSVSSMDTKESPSTTSNRTPSPSKALRKASHSLSSALKKCCSTDVDQGGVGGQQNKGYVAEGQEGGGRAGQRRVSRAVSTCNLLDMSSMLPAVGAGSGVDVSDRALARKCVLCDRNLFCADPDRLGGIKANLYPPHLLEDLCSVVDSRFHWLEGSQGDGPPPCDLRHVCCSLVKSSGGRGRQPMRRCLSISSIRTLDQTVCHVSTGDHGHSCHDFAVSGHPDMLVSGYVPDDAMLSSTLTELNVQKLLSSVCCHCQVDKLRAACHLSWLNSEQPVTSHGMA